MIHSPITEGGVRGEPGKAFEKVIQTLTEHRLLLEISCCSI